MVARGSVVGLPTGVFATQYRRPNKGVFMAFPDDVTAFDLIHRYPYRGVIDEQYVVTNGFVSRCVKEFADVGDFDIPILGEQVYYTQPTLLTPLYYQPREAQDRVVLAGETMR